MNTIKQLKQDLFAWERIADGWLDLLMKEPRAHKRKEYVAKYYKCTMRMLNTEQVIQNRRKTAKLRQRLTLRANAKQYQRNPIINLCEVIK